MYRSIKGTKDILPQESFKWQFIESTVKKVFHRFNYKEIRTPVFEQTSLFARSIGELTDIVGKEMYTFNDRSSESVTLRPEGTASVIRAFIQNNMGEAQPLVKVYYMGPMFRQERPQAGRLRQFHQFGAEVLGSPHPESDAEIIVMTQQIYRELAITNTALKINSVGCEKCRPAYKETLQNELRTIASSLSGESQKRIDQNPMRVLDSKNDNDKILTAGMPLICNFLCLSCSDHFEAVKSFLRNFGINFEVDGRLVRGLDYYTKTAFEFTSTDLGSQDALAGGGRYDLLTAELGGKMTPGVGFAAGIERLLMVMERNNIPIPHYESPILFIAPADEPSRLWAVDAVLKLREKGFPVETDFLRRSLKAQMREADRQKARFSLVVGSNELEKKSGLMKAMDGSGVQVVDLTSIGETLQKILC